MRTSPVIRALSQPSKMLGIRSEYFWILLVLTFGILKLAGFLYAALGAAVGWLGAVQLTECDRQYLRILLSSFWIARVYDARRASVVEVEWKE